MSSQNKSSLNRALERAFENRMSKYLPPRVPILASQAIGYGVSGNKYVFNVHPLYTKLLDVGGIYAFTRQYVDLNGYVWYQLLYIGETQSLMKRVAISHEQWGCAMNNNVNSICAFREDNANWRGLFEHDLLLNYVTTCNKQFQ